jgi:hypothetical protein
MTRSDRFETEIYWVEELSRFHTIDYCAKPTSKSWVVVERLTTGEVFIESFCGQPFIGVVRWLNDYLAQPTWRAQERERIGASAQRQMLDVEPTAEALQEKKKPRKERNPFPRNLAC